MDALNEKMGKGTVRLDLPEKNAPWHLRCANRRPHYTTHWDELMKMYTDEARLKDQPLSGEIEINQPIRGGRFQVAAVSMI